MLFNFNDFASQIGATSIEVLSASTTETTPDGRFFAEYTSNGAVLASIQHSSVTASASEHVDDRSHIEMEQDERVLYGNRTLKTTKNSQYPDRVVYEGVVYEVQDLINNYISLGGFASYRLIQVQDA